MKEIMKRYFRPIIICSILIIVVIPLIIHISFFIPAPFRFLRADWRAGEILMFYGSIISFAGTFLLGAIAIYQNKRVHELNNQMRKLQEANYISMVNITRLEIKKWPSSQNYRNKNMPDIETIDLSSDGLSNTHNYLIDLELENISKYPIVQLVIYPNNKSDLLSLTYGINPHVDKSIYIPANGKHCVRLAVPSKMFEGHGKYCLNLRIWFINIFDYQTKTSLYINDLENKNKKSDYQFRLAKYVDIRPKEEEPNE